MKLDFKEDIEAPIEFVFERLSDFRAIERAAMRRGAEVQRVDTLTADGPGMAWDACFELHGRRRDLKLELADYAPPERLAVASRSPSVGGVMTVDLVALSPGRTRMVIELDLVSKSLSGKLLLQSLKLARKSLVKRVGARLAEFSGEIGRRYRDSA